jgi:phospholipid/cholesterol/gamma-HCH transport system substrate-binding protein
MKIQPWTIGLFIVIGFALSTAILFMIGDRHKAFGEHMKLYSEFADLGGLANGAKVRVSGFDAGEIKKITIPANTSEKFRLELQIEGKVRGMIRKDSIASIETEGVVGDKFVSIKKGTDKAGEAEPGMTLPSKEPIDMGALLERGSGLLTDVHETITDVRGRVDVALDSITKTVNHGDDLIVGLRPNLTKMSSDATQITSKIDAMLTDLSAGKGPAGLLLKDEPTRQQLQVTLSNVQQATANIRQASVGVDQAVTDFQSRQLIAKVDTTLNNVQALSQQLNTTLHEALDRDNMGDDGATNLRETLSNMSRATTNLAEDTEALKHNFFLRGFFKKRGFYNLDQLTPSDYLAATERQKNAGSRLWLDAPQLFASGSNGEEELTEAGRHHVDTQVASVIDSLPDRLVVVEGYANTGSPDEQFLKSRKRADLVRRYLERKYHLRRSNVGIVALRNRPPEASGRSQWDGAAIMLLGPQTK